MYVYICIDMYIFIYVYMYICTYMYLYMCIIYTNGMAKPTNKTFFDEALNLIHMHKNI